RDQKIRRKAEPLGREESDQTGFVAGRDFGAGDGLGETRKREPRFLVDVHRRAVLQHTRAAKRLRPQTLRSLPETERIQIAGLRTDGRDFGIELYVFCRKAGQTVSELAGLKLARVV